MELKMMKLADVRPYERTPHRTEESVKSVAESIRMFGFRQPVVVDAEGVIVCGHARYYAARRLEMERIPVLVADDLSKDAIRAYRVLDNKSGEKSTWDPALLRSELSGLPFDFSLFNIDFTMDLNLGTDAPSPEPPVKTRRQRARRQPGESPRYWNVMVACADEEEQEDLYNRLTREGYKVKLCSL